MVALLKQVPVPLIHTFFSFLYYYSMQNLEMLRFQTYFFFFPLPSSLFPPYYIK